MRKYACLTLFALLAIMVAAQPRIVAPADGFVTQNNMPTLSWTADECDHYELWVNGHMMAEVPAEQCSYTAFPMSYGANDWRVVAVKGDRRVSSETSSLILYEGTLSSLPSGAQLLRKGWMVRSSLVVGMDGATLSSQAPDADWHETSVPATVLTALVRNGVYPNPYVGMNNMMIPDANDAYNEKFDMMKYSHLEGQNPWSKPYWFVKSFEVNNAEAEQIWLNFNELNYRADVWLNGKKIADHTQVVGMERQFRFNLNKYVKREGENILAVAIYPVDEPGMPADDPVEPLDDPGTNMADGILSHSYTKWDCLGWDWQPPVRDRDMGITEEVFLSFTNNIEVDDLYVTSEPIAPAFDKAPVVISARVINHSIERKEVTLNFTIRGHGTDFVLVKSVSVAPLSATPIYIDEKEFDQLLLSDPALWWPFGYGDQPLYTLEVVASTEQHEQFTMQESFGVRKVETYVGCPERVIKVNGVNIYPRGGNWVIDMMLNWGASRYEKEILLTKNAGLNMLRVWGPTGVAPKAMYDAADKYGVLMWQDYLNDFWGTFKNTPGFQPDADLFKLASVDITKRYRNHPSLVMWCGGNEGLNPREELLLETVIKDHDNRNSRFYLRTSNGDGLHGGGPYNTIAPKDYFLEEKLMGFSSEVGPSGLPVAQSFEKFMPQLGQLPYAEGRFPLDGVWAYHDATNFPNSDPRKFTTYDEQVRNGYGAPEATVAGAKEYIHLAQAVNYDVYRASIEAINHQLWRNASGIVLWKSNSSWPSVTWQVYDWYMQSHAGYYATKNACAPLHVQLIRDSMTVSVMNLTQQPIERAVVEATLYDANLKKVWSDKDTTAIEANSALTTSIHVDEPSTMGFLLLSLTDEASGESTDNLYWIGEDNDYSQLATMQAPRLSIKAKVIRQDDERTTYSVTVKNVGKTLAFMSSFSIVGKESKQEFLPALWSDNFISLMPRSHKVLTVEIFNSDITETPQLQYSDFTHKQVRYYNIK